MQSKEKIMGTVKSIANRMLHGYFINRKTKYTVYVNSPMLTQTILAFLTNTSYYWVDAKKMLFWAHPAVEQSFEYKLCKVKEMYLSCYILNKGNSK
jgi:hypothetical protein